MKKLVTVSWCYTVEIDLPEETTVSELENASWGGESKELNEIATAAVEQAGANLSWRDGMITDIQDI
jgi:hypothetical protein